MEHSLSNFTASGLGFAFGLTLLAGLATGLGSALSRLQRLVGALLKSLGAMGYVSLLLALMFYIYGVARVGAPVAAPLYFISFILLGTMIMLNLFIGIIMNSMPEMHAEIAERDRQRHVTETGAATVEDELCLLEQQIESLKDQAARARRRLRQKPSRVPEP